MIFGMTELQNRQEKIQIKRKQTPWRDFVIEICSWKPLMFYKNSGMISIYPTERAHKVLKSWQYYDQISDLDVIGGSFFENIAQLIHQNGYPATNLMQTENSDFSDTTIRSKNIYLSNTVITECENIMYSFSVKDKSNTVFDSIMVRKQCENVYKSRCIIESYNIFYSNNIHNSNNVWFSSNLIGCSECILCDDLSNQSYCIQNKQYTKEQYSELKNKVLQQKDIFHNAHGQQWHNIASSNITGSSNIECHDCEHTFLSFNTKQWKNLILMGSSEGASNVYDCLTGGSPYAHDFYGVMWAGASEQVYCSMFVNGWCSNIYYCIDMEACSCILNKQYTKEERYIKVDEIFSQMEKDWQLWEFFPASMNPFYFNDTAAYLIDNSFTKEEVTAKWYLRRDEPIKVDIPEGMEIIKTSELWSHEWFDSEWNRTINADVLKKVIQDEQWNVYRIIPMEYKFLVKHGLPLPRKHWLERMKENFKIN